MIGKKKAVSHKNRKASSPVEPSVSCREKKCVRITEADNGFTVSSYGPRGEEIKVATSMPQAMRHVKELMGSSKK